MPKFDDFESEDDENGDGGIRKVLTSLLQFADKGKNEVGSMVAHELKELLKTVDARDLLLSLLSQGTIEIDAKIRIVPKGAKAKKQAKAQATHVKVKATPKRKT